MKKLDINCLKEIKEIYYLLKEENKEITYLYSSNIEVEFFLYRNFIKELTTEKIIYNNKNLNEYTFLTCFSILYNIDNFIDNLIYEIINQSYFKYIIYKLYLFEDTNSDITNKKVKNLINNYKNIEIEYYSKNNDPGLYALWNKAIKESKTIFVSSFNPDDKRGSKWAEYLLNNIKPEYNIYCGSTIPFDNIKLNYNEIIDGRKSEWFNKKKSLTKDRKIKIEYIGEDLKIQDLFQIYKNKVKSFTIPNSSPIWDKNIHNIVGFFSDNINYSDWELWLKSLNNGIKIRYMKDYKVGFYTSPNQLHKKEDEKSKNIFISIIKKYAPIQYYNYYKLNDKFQKHT